MTIDSEKWIESLPKEWSITKIGNHFKCRNEKVNDTDYPPLSVAKQGVVPQIETVAKTDANDNRKLVLMNDFVINSRSDRKESCGLSKLNGSVSLINHVLYQNGQDYYMPFVGILFKNYGFAEEFYRWGHGIVADLWTTRWQEMKNIEIPLPPLKEQKLIFDFLTNRTSKIDQLISNQERQIEKLKEYRQAIITKSVTKGLDPNAPMKDSGVEWIGKIKQDYRCEKLKFLLSSPLLYGANESGGKQEKGCTRFIRITDIDSNGNLKDTNDNQFLSASKSTGYILKNKDILFARSGGTVGKSFLYKDQGFPCSFAGYLIKAECNETLLLPEFLYYYTKSSLYEIWKNMIFVQSTIQNIGAQRYGNLDIVIPSIAEQKQIVQYIDKKCMLINKLIDIKDRTRKQLLDFKQSLIYEYVTGKKRVSL
jgi:type I restriction enzyme S subunit